VTFIVDRFKMKNLGYILLIYYPVSMQSVILINSCL